MPRLRARILLSMAIGIVAGLSCWGLLTRLQLGAYDFTWALRPARDLLAGRNPYINVPAGAVAYPMTAVLLATPLAKLPDTVAAGIFFGLSSALLALGLTRHGYGRLLVFLAYPYWVALLTAQWTPLMLAAGLFPLALPLTAAKPQVGLPVFLTHLTKRGLLASVAFVALTFLVMPTWVKFWLRQAMRYEHFFPLLVLPGPLVLLALLRYRERDAQLLLWSLVMPQRWFFDTFTLWLIPKSRREILFTVALSWGAGIWRSYHPPHSFTQVGTWTVLFIYLPMLTVVLLRHPSLSARPVDAAQTNFR